MFLFEPGHSPSSAASVKGVAQRFAAAYDMDGVYVDKAFGERLAAVDQVRSEQRALRIGWLFVTGQITGEDGKRRRVFHPLVTMPVRVHRAPMAGPERAFIGAGDAELSPLIADREVRRRLEQQVEFGRGVFDRDVKAALDPALLTRLTHLVGFARSAASAAGLAAHAVVPASEGPDDLLLDKTLRIVAGVGVFTVREAGIERAAAHRTSRIPPTERIDLPVRWVDAPSSAGVEPLERVAPNLRPGRGSARSSARRCRR